jgi:hypothetical protein
MDTGSVTAFYTGRSVGRFPDIQNRTFNCVIYFEIRREGPRRYGIDFSFSYKGEEISLPDGFTEKKIKARTDGRRHRE